MAILTTGLTDRFLTATAGFPLAACLAPLWQFPSGGASQHQTCNRTEKLIKIKPRKLRKLRKVGERGILIRWRKEPTYLHIVKCQGINGYMVAHEEIYKYSIKSLDPISGMAAWGQYIRGNRRIEGKE